MAQIKELRKKLLLNRVSRLLAEQTLDVVRADKTVSRSIKQELHTRLMPGGTTAVVRRKVSARQFWAQHYHDGRGPVTARAGRWLAFWKQVPKAFDPRLRGGRFPVKRSQVRSLRDTMSDEDFRRAIESGELTLTKRVGPWRGNRFFPRAFRKQKRDPFLRRDVENLIEREITRILDPITKTTARKPERTEKIFLRIKRQD